MPWQLIFTSAPRGLTPGQSGYCTVARSREMREGLVSRLEKLSYYHPAAEGEVIFAYRIIDLRGAPFHLLTRICDAGLDFTKRRKFLAHHLVFPPDDLPRESPAEIFLKWPEWKQRWEGDPIWMEETTGFQRGENNAWGITFTSRVQEGDKATDFQVIWDGVQEPAGTAANKIEEPSKPPIIAEKSTVEAVVVPKRWRFRPLWIGAATALFVACALLYKPRKPVETSVLPAPVGSSRVDLQACKLEYSIVSPK